MGPTAMSAPRQQNHRENHSGGLFARFQKFGDDPFLVFELRGFFNLARNFKGVKRTFSLNIYQIHMEV